MADPDLAVIFEGNPGLAGLRRFLRLVPAMPWFRHVGDPMDADLAADAADYVAALGFPEVEPAIVALWEDAAAACETLDYNSPAWEAEEQFRIALVARALEWTDEETLNMLFAHVGAIAAEAGEEGAADSAAFLAIGDPAFVRLATGAAVQACHQAALVLAAGGDPVHPFSCKFRLFEHGRWPLPIVGGSLNIF